MAADSPIDVLGRIRELHQQGRTDDALDVIFRWFDQAAKDGRWADSAELLGRVDLPPFDEDIVVGFLGASYPSREHLGDARDNLWARLFAATGLTRADFSGVD